MNRLTRSLALGIAAVVISGTLDHCPAATPPLRDFGYGHMRTDRTIQLAVILVNFTNQPVADTVAFPYPMGDALVGTDYPGAERYYSNWFFAVSGAANPTVNGYFFEASNGRMGCGMAGLTMLTLDTNLNYGSLAARVGAGPTADRLYASNFLWLAASKPSFATVTNCDANRDRWITSDECTLVLLTNDRSLAGGGQRGPYELALPNSSIRWFSEFTFQHAGDGNLAVVCHELVHVMQGDYSRDIYGPDKDLSYGYTVMSGGSLIVHPDAWHKMQIAWCEPRIQSMREGALLTLPAAQLMRTNGPVILYDPADPQRNTKEFFILEYRTSSISADSGYDQNVPKAGLVIWHMRHNSDKNPVEYTQTYFPNAERDWRRCENCQGLFFADGTDRPCPSGNAGHQAVSGHICLPYNDPSAGGVSGWRWCTKCSQLFYLPNVATSVCQAGGRHVGGTGDYHLRLDTDPEALGHRGWWHCSKCQCLVRGGGACAAGGTHAKLGTANYTVLWWQELPAIMTAGSPDLARGRGSAWGSGETTPLLRYYDGAESRARLVVRPFKSGADQITVELQTDFDTWVDFGHLGTETGSFDLPFNTFTEGVNTVYPGGNLHIKTGSSSETGTVTKAMKIETYNGPVSIGRK